MITKDKYCFECGAPLEFLEGGYDFDTQTGVPKYHWEVTRCSKYLGHDEGSDHYYLYRTNKPMVDPYLPLALGLLIVFGMLVFQIR